ncbi:MAG: type II toxin-antitoxin system prevent-host-death family antitoxin [Magnetospirillum sp. WYHS-4]
MNRIVNLYEAKTHLSSLVDAVAAGEEVVIAKNGKPKVRLMPVETAGAARQPGQLKGRIWIADDFDDPMPDAVQVAFEGGGDDPA